jgi:cell division protein FtsQ
MMALVASLDHALGRVMRPLANLLPRRVRRVAEKIERRRTAPIGQIAATGFLLATIFYGLIAGGQIGRLGDAALVFIGFGIDNVEITGDVETPELAVLEKLELGGSLVAFDVAGAQERIAELPWVARATVRKFYPSTLSVEIEERKPYALWQRKGEVYVIDKTGKEIVTLGDSRFGKLPFVVGEGANEAAEGLLGELAAQPDIAGRTRAAVLVAARRWDLYLEDGVTVRLPEKKLGQALAQLVKLDSEQQLLERDVVVVDLRLPDRVTVRLPEGRSLDDVISGGAKSTSKSTKART